MEKQRKANIPIPSNDAWTYALPPVYALPCVMRAARPDAHAVDARTKIKRPGRAIIGTLAVVGALRQRKYNICYVLGIGVSDARHVIAPNT